MVANGAPFPLQGNGLNEEMSLRLGQAVGLASPWQGSHEDAVLVGGSLPTPLSTLLDSDHD